MSIPPSLRALGYQTLEEIAQNRAVMIGIEGETNTGKSEFGLSCPGPVAWLALDRNIDGVAHNSNPPATRRSDVAIKLVETKGNIGMKGQAPAELKAAYLQDWKDWYACHKAILDNNDVRTIMYDSASDDWELQRLAEFGTLSQIPSIMYDSINAARKKMTRDMYDSGKIIIATHKITDVYEDKIGPDGQVVMGNNGKPVQIKSGEKRRQGFHDYKYLWQIQIRTLYKPPSVMMVDNKPIKTPGKFGLRILECKPKMSLIGSELWGEDCCFEGLVSLVYPNIDPAEWGL